MSVFSCAGPARTTRLHAADFQEAASRIALDLRTSEFLSGRTAGSEPMMIALEKVENLSSDILSEGERWYLVDRVMNSEMMASLRRERNVRFVIPAERWTAAVRAVTRSAGRNRTDLYAMEYRITRIEDGETAWAGEYLLKRAAVGRGYN